jgi:hypothetical protein
VILLLGMFLIVKEVVIVGVVTGTVGNVFNFVNVACNWVVAFYNVLIYVVIVVDLIFPYSKII